MTYVPDAKRYEQADFRRCGRSGILLPPISLGALAELWWRQMSLRRGARW